MYFSLRVGHLNRQVSHPTRRLRAVLRARHKRPLLHPLAEAPPRSPVSAPRTSGGARLRFFGAVSDRDDRSAGWCEPPALRCLIAPSIRSGWPRDGRPSAGQPPAGGLGSTPRSGPAIGLGRASPTAPTSSPRCSPADQRSPRARAKSRPCRRRKAGRCNRPRAD